MDLSSYSFRKSTHCGCSGTCVEVAGISGNAAVRDAKNSSGPILVFPAEPWQTFVISMKSAQ
ncbi:DUF397 domain-containing protein [Pseudonocardiaceae bacterium YIM PH 21723]|nr:DUF397 domain-containing protein [Pseudonocardiaceae bacterium YIM PH 21723]